MNVTAQAGDTLIQPCSLRLQTGPVCKPDWRSALRKQRRSIAPSAQRRAARRLAQLVFACAAVRRAQRIAVYLSMGSELSTELLIAALQTHRIKVFAPAILRGQMRFRSLGCASLQAHRLGMQQPRCGIALRAAAMDVVLLPLLGFDSRGTRLGQGGGYYDRALSKTRFRPYRMGLAYAAQQVDALPRESWDVPLHAVLTERGMRRFAR